jgi:hypothetical protein
MRAVHESRSPEDARVGPGARHEARQETGAQLWSGVGLRVVHLCERAAVPRACDCSDARNRLLGRLCGLRRASLVGSLIVPAAAGERDGGDAGGEAAAHARNLAIAVAA